MKPGCGYKNDLVANTNFFHVSFKKFQILGNVVYKKFGLAKALHWREMYIKPLLKLQLYNGMNKLMRSIWDGMDASRIFDTTPHLTRGSDSCHRSKLTCCVVHNFNLNVFTMNFLNHEDLEEETMPTFYSHFN
jgi:hypothetical protein